MQVRHGGNMEKPARILYEFDGFVIDTLDRTCLKDARVVALTPLAFSALVFMIERSGRLASRNELLVGIWPDTFTDDSNLAVMISVVRKALGDSARSQKYIETVAKAGYRFVAPVKKITIPTEEATPSPAPFHVNDAVIHHVNDAIIRHRFIPIRLGAIVLTAILIFFVSGASTSKAPAVSPSSRSFEAARQAHQSLFPAASIQAVDMRSANPGEALSWYLKGRYSWSRGTETGLKQSVIYFRNSIAADPSYAPAYAGLADAYCRMTAWSVESADVAWAKAEEAARTAIRLDNSLSLSHSALGLIALYRDNDSRRAGQEFRRAIELAPNEPLAHQRMGLSLAASGNLDDALREMRLARDLDPLNLNIGIAVGHMLYFSRRYGEAIEELRKVTELDPHYSEAHYSLARVYYAQEDYKEAIRELEITCNLVNYREPLSFGLLAAARARNGDPDAARVALAELHRRSEKGYVSPLSMAYIYLALRQSSEALMWIGKMFDDRLAVAVFASVDPVFDAVRGHPRFRSLTDRTPITADFSASARSQRETIPFGARIGY